MPKLDLLSDVTAVIKTFERPKCLDRLLRSIKRYYPAMRTIVADDSFDPYPRTGVEYVRLQPDVGLSAGRNALLSRVQTPYFLLLDDDFEFTAETKVEKLASVVVSGEADLVAGACIWCKPKLLWVKRKRSEWYGTLELRDGNLIVHAGSKSVHDGFMRCDIVNNFFVARTDFIRSHGGWDEQLKLNEHEEFFIRFYKLGLRVAYCPDVSVLHWHARPRKYTRYRNRDYRQMALRKHGIRQLTEMNGRIVLVSDEPEVSAIAA